MNASTNSYAFALLYELGDPFLYQQIMHLYIYTYLVSQTDKIYYVDCERRLRRYVWLQFEQSSFFPSQI